MQVSDAAASQQDHMAQAGNSTYLMESFNKLVHDLEEPLGVSRPLLWLLSAACLIHPCQRSLQLAVVTAMPSCISLLCCTWLTCMRRAVLTQ